MELSIRNKFDFVTAVVPRVKSSRATAVKDCKRCHAFFGKRRASAVTKSNVMYQVDEEPLCGCATCKSLFIYLFNSYLLTKLKLFFAK